MCIPDGLAIAGSGIAAKQITLKSQSERTDVFTEVKAGDPVRKGFADLIIKANIKIHLESYYIAESNEFLHGGQGYPFLIDIGGQGASISTSLPQGSFCLKDPPDFEYVAPTLSLPMSPVGCFFKKDLFKICFRDIQNNLD